MADTTSSAPAFIETVILQCLPGTAIEIAKQSGYHVVSVKRAMRKLQARGLAHRSGWKPPAHRGAKSAIYADGPSHTTNKEK